MLKSICWLGSLLGVLMMGISPLSSQAYQNAINFSSPVPNFPKNDTSACIHTETLKNLLRKLAQSEFSEFQEAQVMLILDYVDMVLEDGILDDPQMYLEAWDQNRGRTREYRMPEDPAHSFFNKYLK